MISKVDEIVEAITLSAPAVAAAVLARRWWKRRHQDTDHALPPAANEDLRARPGATGAAMHAPSTGPMALDVEPQWPASFHFAESCRRLNRNMAESAHLSRRGRNVIVEIGNRQRTAELISVLRGVDDQAAWRLLEPITVSGEVITLIESVRQQNGEFSAQSLRLCIERLWGQRVAREDDAGSEQAGVRRTDPAASSLPPA